MCLAYRTLDASPSSTNFEELLSPHGPWKRKDQYNMQMGTLSRGNCALRPRSFQDRSLEIWLKGEWATSGPRMTTTWSDKNVSDAPCRSEKVSVLPHSEKWTTSGPQIGCGPRTCQQAKSSSGRPT